MDVTIWGMALPCLPRLQRRQECPQSKPNAFWRKSPQHRWRTSSRRPLMQPAIMGWVTPSISPFSLKVEKECQHGCSCSHPKLSSAHLKHFICSLPPLSLVKEGKEVDSFLKKEAMCHRSLAEKMPEAYRPLSKHFICFVLCSQHIQPQPNKHLLYHLPSYSVFSRPLVCPPLLPT